MTKRQPAECGGGVSDRSGRPAMSVPQAVGTASLVAAGLCAWWLGAGDLAPKVSPVRVVCLMAVCAYLVSATLLLLEDR